ncbi:MAG TPA: hypothetical protein VGX23_12495 [Actinocrinis sp.]|nr:hypothetical protein [Actinocrinis sp.]
MEVTITVEQAAHEFLLSSVAALEEYGQRVWWKRCAWQDGHDNGHSFSYWLTVNDDEHETWFAPVYHGDLGDQLPEGFDEFTLFIEGGKNSIDVLLDEDAEPGDPPNTRSREEFYDADDRLLEFVTRVTDEPDPIDWFSRADAYLRCFQCGSIVAVAKPDDECFCHTLSRAADGTLQRPDLERNIIPVYVLAPEPEPEPAAGATAE